jgi:hypothetical protein
MVNILKVLKIVKSVENFEKKNPYLCEWFESGLISSLVEITVVNVVVTFSVEITLCV